MSQRFVVIGDLVGEAQGTSQIFEGKLFNLMDYFNSLVRTISKPALITHLIDSETRSDKNGLVAAGNILDLLASETWSRTNKSYDAIVFIIPEGVPMNDLRYHLLASSDMAHIPRPMTGLRKRTQRHSYPLMLQVRAEIPATLFISDRSISAVTTTFKIRNDYRENTLPER